MRNLMSFAFVSLLAASSGGVASAITVDGVLDPGYGASTATVGYSAAAPESNFGAPTNQSDAIGYNIYLKDTGGTLYGFLQGDASAGAPVGSFANLYFGCSCAMGQGSVFGFEVTNKRAFIPGDSGYTATPSVTFAAVGDNIEFAIPNILFETQGLFDYVAAKGDTITLRLSQSFGYSVAGGPSYGDNRLGSVTLAAGAPEASTWMMMIFGFAGLVLFGHRRARSSSAPA